MILRLSNRQLFLYGLVIILFGIVIGSVSLTYPFGRDQGFYAYIGKLLLEGKMNYLYAFDLKPPGSQFLFALAQFLSGDSMFNFRIFDMVWQTLTAYVLFIIAFRLTDRKSLSLLSALLYLFLYYRQDYWHTLQADGSLNLPFAVCVLLLVSSYDRHSFVKIFLSGVMFAGALLFKYTIVSFLPLVIICFLISRKEVLSIRVKNIAAFLLGITVLTGLTALLYISTGAFKELVNIQFVQTPLYTKIAYATETGEFISSQLIRLFSISVYAPLIYFSLFALILLLIKKKLDFVNALVMSWVFSSLFSLIIQWKFYYYHFLVIIPALSLGAVVFVSLVMNYAGQSNRKIITALFVILFIGFTAYAFKPYAGSYEILSSYLSGKETLKEVYIKNGFTADSVFMIRKTFNAVDYVNQHTNAGDLIYVWGYDPLVYYLSGRKCVSRFIYNVPLLWKGENTEFRKEFMNEINKNNPKLILVTSGDPLYFISGYNEDSKQLLERFGELTAFIKDKYVFRKRIDDYDIYELKNW